MKSFKKEIGIPLLVGCLLGIPLSITGSGVLAGAQTENPSYCVSYSYAMKRAIINAQRGEDDHDYSNTNAQESMAWSLIAQNLGPRNFGKPNACYKGN